MSVWHWNVLSLWGEAFFVRGYVKFVTLLSFFLILLWLFKNICSVFEEVLFSNEILLDIFSSLLSHFSHVWILSYVFYYKLSFIPLSLFLWISLMPFALFVIEYLWFFFHIFRFNNLIFSLFWVFLTRANSLSLFFHDLSASLSFSSLS